MPRLCYLLLICLLCSVPRAFAQNEPAQDIQAAIENHSPSSNAALLASVANARWAIAAPAFANDPALDTKPPETNAPLISLKPAPITLPELAQSNPHYRWGLEFAIGGFQPKGQTGNFNHLNTNVAFGFNVAIRPKENLWRLQLDAGADLVIDGIGAPLKEEIARGAFRGVDDVETFFNVGPRVYLTPRGSSIKFSLGLGGALAYYKEAMQTFNDNPIGDDKLTPCFSCASRHGLGAYALSQLRYQISPIFGVGLTAKYYRVKTSGALLNGSVSNESVDRWLGFMLTFSIR